MKGGTPRQLTQHTHDDEDPYDVTPTWSPAGTQIAFQNSGPNPPTRLLEIAASGGTPNDLRADGAAFPTWGPKLIAYTDDGLSHLVIKTIDPATGAVQTVATGGKSEVQALAWSRRGRLAYLSMDQRTEHILLTIVGPIARPLDLSAHLPSNARVAGLAWSPDGTRFAFAATDRNGNGEIYTIRTDGSALRQVTMNIGALDGVGYESGVSWR
jgi:Tol biopolymer transport system component